MKLAKRPLWLFLTVLLVFLIVGVNEGSHAFAKTAAMENEFQRAAKRYQVPVALLKAVSYNESRWDSHSGKPSVAGGYGVMHLTDVTGLTTRGADSAAVKTPNAASLHTLQKAAKLTGLSVHQLKTNTAANIQGGAALLRFYQKSLGKSLTANLNSWYAAVAKYSQSDSKVAANYFAENVYQILKDGESQNGITIAPQKVVHLKDQSINSDSTASSTDGPSGLPIEWIPALYKEFDDQGDYGNYDLADRPNDMKINYIVIHNTETSFQEALDLFSTPTYTTANYVVSSVEGTVAEMVRPQNVAWHAGNWYINSHSIGIEHEGYATVGGFWYTENMYRSSAALVKYLANQYDIPLDRQHIIGHDNVPGLTPAAQKTMHWDPGTYWNWDHYFSLMGVNLRQSQGRTDSSIITITPDSQHNLTADSGEKVTDAGVNLPLAGSNFVYLHQQPSFSSSLIADKDFSSGQSGTTEKDDWGDKAVFGQQFNQIGQSGDWTEITYGGQNAWFYNPNGANSTSATGKLVTPKGNKAVSVYGSAYPSNQILKKNKVTGITPTPIYQIQPGQKYVYGGEVTADYFNSHFDSNSPKNVIHGNERYYQIQFNHRIAFVKADDVTLSSH
ncbi:N-acetylmuramoyl-L-alanine amidase [uncultured Lentilactobacillus sp.]|uniref:N-acetylmuramoyl-L-alanine amidase n=1 Tax=uncultured Lentilactobacillus sp. TaxID=2805375 RepID=UPI00259AD87E|nr:N-acetylmuramoyl-L-alanine amidase [uncultured Lentilactobacillus sp.]